jgi:hypothetical protein
MRQSGQTGVRSPRVVVWALLAICAAVTTTGGQNARRVVRGVVLDARDQPVPAASISLTAGAIGAVVVSDDSGKFQLEIPKVGRVVFEVRRLGYMPSRFDLAAGGDTTVSVLLLPLAQRLSSVDVSAPASNPAGLAGFEARMRARQRAAGTGHFLTAKDIEAKSPIRTTQVVENVPSISVHRVSGDKYAIYGRSTNGGECLATVWVDGVRIAGAAEPAVDRRTRRVVMAAELPEIDMYVTPNELAGVEVYARGMLAPPQFVPAGDPNAIRCAIVVLWTKHGR